MLYSSLPINTLCFFSRDNEVIPPADPPGDWLEVMWPCVWSPDRQAKQGETLCSQISTLDLVFTFWCSICKCLLLPNKWVLFSVVGVLCQEAVYEQKSVCSWPVNHFPPPVYSTCATMDNEDFSLFWILMFGQEDFILLEHLLTHLVVNHIELVLNEIKQSYKAERIGLWISHEVCMLNKVWNHPD